MKPGKNAGTPVGNVSFLWPRGRWLVPFAFLFPLAVRSIPEFLAGPDPLGFDTVFLYAPFAKVVATEGLGAALERLGATRSAPLLYLFLGVGALSGAEPFLLTKVAGPILQGLREIQLFRSA